MHGEVKVSKLTPEELAEVIDKYGPPTAPLNHYKSRWFTTDPAKRARCKHDCDRPHYALGMCRYHYNKSRLSK